MTTMKNVLIMLKELGYQEKMCFFFSFLKTAILLFLNQLVTFNNECNLLHWGVYFQANILKNQKLKNIP